MLERNKLIANTNCNVIRRKIAFCLFFVKARPSLEFSAVYPIMCPLSVPCSYSTNRLQAFISASFENHYNIFPVSQ